MSKVMMKLFIGIHILMYKLSGGRLGSKMRGFEVLLLTTKGRKSGKERTVPLGFFREGDKMMIVGSNGGQDRHPGWYFNIKSNPTVTIQVEDKVLTAQAEEVSEAEYDQLWDKLVSEAPAYEAYREKTSRKIPLVLLNPQSAA